MIRPLYLWLIVTLLLLALATYGAPPIPQKGATILIRRQVHPLASAPPTNFVISVHIMVPFQIQSSPDFAHWTPCTNINFADVYFSVPNNQTNLFFRGYWPNAPVQITQTNLNN